MMFSFSCSIRVAGEKSCYLCCYLCIAVIMLSKAVAALLLLRVCNVFTAQPITEDGRVNPFRFDIICNYCTVLPAVQCAQLELENLRCKKGLTLKTDELDGLKLSVCEAWHLCGGIWCWLFGMGAVRFGRW